LALLIDSKHRLWVGSYDTGLSLFDNVRDRFINFLPRSGDSSWYESPIINGIMEDRDGNLWLETQGVVRVEIPDGSNNLDSIASGIHFTTYPLGTPAIPTSGLSQRQDGTILVASDKGLFILDPTTHTISRPQFSDSLGRRVNSTSLQCMIQDSHGNTWLGSVTEGLFRIDWEKNKVWNYRHKKENDFLPTSEIIRDLAEDRDGNIWVGSEGGVYLFSPKTGQYIPYLTFDASLSGQSINTWISVDFTGTLWIGLVDAGLHWLSQKSRRFPLYGLPEGTGSSPISFMTIELDHNGNCWLFSTKGVLYQVDIRALKILKTIDVFAGKKPSYQSGASFIDAHGTYWYGSWGLGLFRVDLSSGKVSNYSREAGLGQGRTVNRIAQGCGDTLWTATSGDGLMKFDPGSERFIDVPIVPERANAVMQDRLGKVWITTESIGIIILDPITGKREQIRHDPANPRSLSNDHVRYTYEDAAGRVWIGAGNVIDLWDGATRSFTHYPNPEFRKALYADPLGSDSKGRIWVRYLQEGVSALDPATGIYNNFDGSDGINIAGDMEVLPDGRMITVRGGSGMNMFHPDSIHLSRPPPPLVLTRMAINDEPVTPPALSGGFKLPFTQNVLEFEFAAIDIDAPQLVRYQYQLEGLEKNWVSPQDRRYVRYPGLPPGDYIFKVRAASIRKEWSDQEITLAIKISPPWWRTTLAYSVYVFLFIGLLYAGYRLRLRQVHMKQQMEMEHFQAEHLAEVDRLKSRFFANISHEFRTPLTLIIGPIEQAIASTRNLSMRQKLHLIKDNAKKLLGLVNQLLDFSRLESGMMRLQVSSDGLNQFLRRVIMSFESWAERKKITLDFHSGAESIQGYFDGDKLEKILNNLLSNALKYTPAGGKVSVSLRSRTLGDKQVQRSEGSDLEMGKEIVPSTVNLQTPLDNGLPEGWIEVSVRDTGTGMSQEHLTHIFDRFYRIDDTHTTEGTGIGLALANELVQLHHGKIAVDSTPGQGSVFFIRLPIAKSSYAADEIVESPPPHQEPKQVDFVKKAGEVRQVSVEKPAEGKPIVLLIEDNADLRQYIADHLAADYAVMEASDGKGGFSKATEAIPDLVISDIMMPEMDGIELCRALKQDIRTSHVPVILLTARAGSDNKIEGLETGADDYVTKPFDARELLARVKNLIEQRRHLRDKFSVGVALKPGEVMVSSLDDALLKRVMEVVEKKMGDEDFSVEELAQEVFLSRRHLDRKLPALTNLSCADFIRQMRLQRARELLEKNIGSVAEIAFRVGFSSPSYFSSCFHEFFGFPPSEVHRKKD
jgi:signal transduction histidine kinase/DNA-binding response OmpR family regulator/ligand-binding sensor domain-containing protein